MNLEVPMMIPKYRLTYKIKLLQIAFAKLKYWGKEFIYFNRIVKTNFLGHVLSDKKYSCL